MEVADQQHGAFLVVFGDDLEDQVDLITAHGQVAYLVDDQQAWSHDVSLDEVGEPVLSLGGNEVGSRDETGLHAGLRGEIAEADRQMGLADAGRAEQHDVLGAFDKRQTGQILNGLLGHAVSEGVIEFLERLDDRDASQLGQDAAGSGLPRRQFGLEQAFQEIWERQLIRDGLGGQLRIGVDQGVELQRLTGFTDAIVLQIYQRTSRRRS